MIEQLSNYPKPVFGGFEPNSLKRQIMDLQKRVEELEEAIVKFGIPYKKL